MATERESGTETDFPTRVRIWFYLGTGLQLLAWLAYFWIFVFESTDAVLLVLGLLALGNLFVIKSLQLVVAKVDGAPKEFDYFA